MDDNRDLARGMGAFFTAAGHEVRVEHDGGVAPAAAKAFRPDVVLLDLGLPGLTGWEVAAQLRADARFEATALLAVSGYGQAEDRRRSAAAGFDAHLTKPVDHDRLLREAARCLTARIAEAGEKSAAPPANGAAANGPVPAPVADGAGAGVRVLVVEDNRAMRFLLERMAAGLGAEVACAADGAAALEGFRSHDPHLILCDLSLPGDLDGCDVGRAITGGSDAPPPPRDAGGRRPARPLLYAVSAHDEEVWRDRLRGAGFDGYVQKPIDHGRLRQLLRDAKPAAAGVGGG